MATTPAYERAKLQKRLRRQVGQAIADYAMIEAGDRVMVCLSGGKDSYTLLDILRQLQATAPIDFELLAVNLDQKQPNFPEHVLPTYLEGLGIEYHIIEQDTYSVVKALTPEGKTYCPVCSRMRRGALYNFARRIGATKVALGHHLDDIVETLFLNLFHGATLKAMPPKLLSDDGDHILIRPLAYCREKDIARWAKVQAFPIIPCDLCGSQDGLERQVIKRMLAEWERAHPARIEKIAGALRRVVPSHLMDRELFDFAGLDAERAARPESLRIPVKEA
ncbi:MAG: tRNA 2-thiocytidine(32) synthetase TtcA [Pseudomonadales bacterium]|nr:tRNA 2-thiocytidine(32) synthetase TtcA [Pseudomonadales bacterium]